MSSQFPTFQRAYNARHRIAGALVSAVKWFGRKLWRSFRFTCKYVLAPLTVLVIVYICLGLFWKHQLDDKFTRIRANGEPATASDLIVKPIPGSENAAVIYQKVFDELKRKSELIVRTESRETTYFPFESIRKFMRMEADPKGWLKNRQQGEIGYTDDPAKICSDARKNVLRYSGVLELARKASLRPKCVYMVKWSSGITGEYGYLSRLQEVCQLLSARAIMQSMDGHVDKALSDVNLGLRVASSVADSPTKMSFNCYSSCVETSMGGLRAISREHDLSYSQAKGLYDGLASIHVEPLFRKALISQRAYDCSWFDESRRNGSEIICIFEQESPSSYLIVLRG